MKKKIWIIHTIGIFLLCFLCHFIYDWFPNRLTCLFFPVNESIWEHVKMLFTANIIWGFIAYFLHKKFEISLDRFFLYLFLSGFLNCIVLLILYLPVYYLFGEHMLVTILILLLSIGVTQFFTSRVNQQKETKWENFVSIVLLIITFCMFGYLTYHPIRCDLFYDKTQEKYGLSTLK